MLINFPYIERDSPIHRLDTRAKLLFLLALGLAVAQTSNFWFMLVALILASIYYGLAHLKWSETRKAWLLIFWINIVIVLGNFFLTGGHVVRGADLTQEHILTYFPFIGFTAHAPFIGPAMLPLSVENITFLITQAMRNFSIALVAISLPYTTNPSHISSAIKGLGIPDSIAYAVDLTFRFLPTVGRDFSTTMDAQRARGFELDKLRGGPFGKIARMAPLVVPLVIGSIIGAEDIINAMELRCFGVTKRTWLIELRARSLDRILIALIIAAFLAITILNILGGYYPDSIIHFMHIQGIPTFLTR
ncbi:energy-coupling factor transporter transmembrane component T family protein [Dictyobacter arantiisoli]|uniref:Cobalt ABC transporter permease n=1 Tax=Dictyobacter arantiisoli TaxID=2014874 RepID=A0A5A5TFG3_9CHLR|nr:energy-coupling factor transporter transmembrane component T [Dictyobacter arantiisoli]GCF09739.1 cobalt ABC transporter permease [Dictyobacter arantiisoli]